MAEKNHVANIVTYPRVGTHAAVQGGVVPSDGEGVDEWLSECWRLCEVTVVILWDFQLQA